MGFCWVMDWLFELAGDLKKNIGEFGRDFQGIFGVAFVDQEVLSELGQHGFKS